MKKDKKFNQNTNKKGDYNNNRGNVRNNNMSKEDREKQLQENREFDYELIDYICAALDNKIDKIYELRNDAATTGNKLSKEETRVGMPDIYEYFKSHDKEFPSKNRISALINVLIDLAKCQVNTRLAAYHVAIRMIYFGEKFQSYFSTEYDQKRQDLIAKYPTLFCTWNMANVVFVRDDKEIDTDIDNIGISMRVDNIKFIG